MSDMQLSMFDFMADMMDDEKRRLRDVLKRGSGFEGGALRIYAAEQLLDDQRFVMFLADEFNVGGHSIPGGFADYNGRGFMITNWKPRKETKYTWKRIAQEYREMICCGEFPGDVVIRMYEQARKAGKGAPAPRMHYWGGDD